MGALERKKIRIEWWCDVVPAEAGNTEATNIAAFRERKQTTKKKPNGQLVRVG